MANLTDEQKEAIEEILSISKNAERTSENLYQDISDTLKIICTAHLNSKNELLKNSFDKLETLESELDTDKYPLISDVKVEYFYYGRGHRRNLDYSGNKQYLRSQML